MMRENPLTAPLALLAPIAALITGINYKMEVGFERRWSSRVLVERERFAEDLVETSEEVAA
jgi:hypothetical protein